MSDLTDHQRKAGRTKTKKKTAASRATIAEARKAKASKRELRARYVAALEEAVEAYKLGAYMTPYLGAVDKARAELGGKR